MNKLVNNSIRFLKDHAPVILSGVAVAGTAVTAYFTGKASYRAALKIERSDPKVETPREIMELVWMDYIPAGVAGVATVVCILGSARMSSRRFMAATGAYALANKAFTEYKEKVIEQIGERKEQEVRDKIAQDHILESPPPQNVLARVGIGSVLCCELHTGRYFTSDMETIRRAVNDVNAKMLKHDTATLDDFYHLVGLKQTSVSNELGWYAERLLELQFTTAITDEGVPCLAFAYNHIRVMHDGGQFRGICMAE